MKGWPAMLAGAVCVAAASWISTARAVEGVALPAPVVDAPLAAGAPQTAVLAGGCFWGVQGVFQHVKGVRQVLSGYAGGERATAHYEDVSTGTTGHAESVQIVFDPAQISYGQILKVFFSVAHDPTQLNRQGPDVGSQYRSAVFFANPQQKDIAEHYIAQLNQKAIFGAPIVTQLAPLRHFYSAEDYHQDYLIEHPRQPYIVFNDLPKIAHLKQLLPELYVEAPVRVRAVGRKANGPMTDPHLFGAQRRVPLLGLPRYEPSQSRRISASSAPAGRAAAPIWPGVDDRRGAGIACVSPLTRA